MSKNTSFWRWHKRYAIVPMKIQGQWYWLKPYWWRRVFDYRNPMPLYYKTVNPPEFDYTDEIVVQEGAEQMQRDVMRRVKAHRQLRRLLDE